MVAPGVDSQEAGFRFPNICKGGTWETVPLALTLQTSEGGHWGEVRLGLSFKKMRALVRAE